MKVREQRKKKIVNGNESGAENMKKKWIAFLLMTTMVSVACSGESSGESGLIWNDNFEQAAAQAKAENKYMFLNFSGSDWCIWCMRLDEQVLSQPAFQEYAKENLIMMVADFPTDKELSKALEEQNQNLALRYGIEGLPTILILDPDANVAGVTGFQYGGAENYVNHIKNIITQYEAKID